jgi:DHA1 family tetracycline resistance protein-like MFS transporter
MNEAGSRGPGQAALFLGLVANGSVPAFLFLVLPAIGRRLGMTDIQTGAILSASALATMLAAPAWGYLSDRIGRRPVLLAGMTGAVLGPLAYGAIVGSALAGSLSIASVLALFFIARLSQAMLSAAVVPSAQAYMADITTPAERLGGMGLIGAAVALASVVSAVLAWQIGSSDGFAAFTVLAVFATIALAGILLLVNEPAPHHARTETMEARLALARIWPFLTITLLGFCIFSGLKQVVTLYFQDRFGFTLDQSITKAGAAMAAMAMAMIVMQAVALRFLSLKAEIMLAIGALLAAASMLLCAFTRNYGELVVALILFGIALGCMMPANLASISLRSDRAAQAKAAGVNVTGQGLGLSIGPLAGAGLYQVSSNAPFVAAAVLLLLCAVLALIASRGAAELRTSHSPHP